MIRCGYLYVWMPDLMKVAHKVTVDEEGMVHSFDDEKFEEPVPLGDYAPCVLTEEPVDDPFQLWCCANTG